jgi:hypothetical protein
MDIFFLLLFGHALGDFGLQSDRIIKNKNKKNNKESWVIYLTAHSVIHGGLVGFFTGSFVLAIAETIAHALIDYGKMEGHYSFKVDQFLHVACKAAWIILMVKGIA